MIQFRPSAGFDKDATVILLRQEDLKKKNYRFNNYQIKNEIDKLNKVQQFSAESGELFPVSFHGKLVILAGLGKQDDLTSTSLRIAVRKALLSHYIKKAKSVEIVSFEQNDETLRSVVEAILIGTYSWDKYKSKKDSSVKIEKKYSIVGKQSSTLTNTVTTCAGVSLTRDLINDNADTVTSVYLENIIRGIVRGKKNVKIEVLNRKQMKAKGLGLHLAVNQGSNKEPKLIIVKYSGASKSSPYTALVGKGMTYDTGGLNLKPTGSIETMKTDMSGAAAVIGTLKNILDLRPKKNIIFAIGIAENAIGSGAYKPGDVYRSYSGKTVEIANTDAEGRLVLADAISYVNKNYNPSKVIDIATLTGACVVALGHDYAGLVTNDDNFSRALVHSSNATDDRIWRMPIYPEIKDAVKSQLADIRNLGYPKGAAGTLTAAEFLRQFVGDKKWAHLDIAGTAYVDGTGRLYYGFGATGFGVRLLTHYLQNN